MNKNTLNILILEELIKEVLSETTLSPFELGVDAYRNKGSRAPAQSKAIMDMVRNGAEMLVIGKEYINGYDSEASRAAQTVIG